MVSAGASSLAPQAARDRTMTIAISSAMIFFMFVYLLKYCVYGMYFKEITGKHAILHKKRYHDLAMLSIDGNVVCRKRQNCG